MIIRKDNLIIVWLSVLSSAMAYEEQKFAMEPQDQTAVVGSRVTLPCRVTGKSGILQWTKDDFGLGTHRNLSGFDRYTMIGSDEEGDFSLDIYPVMLDDDARYQCQVSPGPLGQPGIRSKFATLTVYVPPDPPRIVQGKHLITTEDREIELECISYGGKPAAEITWIDGHGNVLTDGIEYIVEELSDGRRFTAKSILKLTPKKEHHNTTFTCQAQNTAERTHRSAKLSLEVKYAPKVTVSIVSQTSSNGRILEGSDVRLRCNADANPPDLTYRWFLNDELIVGDYTTELLLHNVTRKYHDSMVKCEVHNPVGKSEESETLDISYAPYFRNKPKSVQGDLGSTKTIACDVDGNPMPEITWLKEDTNEVVSNNPNLTVKVDRKTAGRYLCKAHIPGFPQVEATAAIYLKGPPNIISRRTQFGIEGDNVRVECTAYSVPAAEHVVWTFNGKEVDVHDQDFSILEDPIPEGIKSTLIIRESQGKHFGNYNCTVSNAYGTDVVEINLIPQITVSENFPILIVIVGVVGAIIVLVIVVMIVFLCQRQGNKKSQPDGENNTMEKQCKESDRSSNISDLKIDLRTGSSVSNVHCDDYVPGIESETGSESVITRIGVPLAGPVAISNQDIYRYSTDYTDANFALKDGQNNNGYVPYVDYARDYNPPMAQLSPIETSESLHSKAHQMNVMQAPHCTISSTITLNDLNSSGSIPNGHTVMGGSIDPRYSAAYGNPYLRSSSVGLPPPNTANPVATPAPPPYSRDTSSSSSRTLVNCSSAAMMNIGAGGASANGGVVTVTAGGAGAAPQLTRLPNSPTNHQYIVSNANIATTKRGALATHV